MRIKLSTTQYIRAATGKEIQIKKFFILFLILTPSVMAMDPQAKKDLAKNTENVNEMVGDGKKYIKKLKKIRRACKVLIRRFHGKKNCQEYSNEILKQVDYIKNSLKELKHPYWVYLKGAAKYAQHCASCDPRETKHFCPLFDKTIKRYDVIR